MSVCSTFAPPPWPASTSVQRMRDRRPLTLYLLGWLFFGIGCDRSELSARETERTARLIAGNAQCVMENDTLWLVSDSSTRSHFIPYHDSILDSLFSELGDFSRDSIEEASLQHDNMHFGRSPYKSGVACWVCDEDFIQAYHRNSSEWGSDNSRAFREQWDVLCRRVGTYALPRRWVRLRLVGGHLYNYCADDPDLIRIQLGDSTYLEKKGTRNWEFSLIHSITTGNGRTWWLHNESSLSLKPPCASAETIASCTSLIRPPSSVYGR